MALNPKTAVAIRNTSLDVFDTLDSGKLRIYSGTQPTDADTAIVGQNLGADLALGADSFAAASSGSKAANTITDDTSADAAITATWGALLTSGNVRKLDFSVGTSGANLNLNSDAIALGATVSVTAFTITQAA